MNNQRNSDYGGLVRIALLCTGTAVAVTGLRVPQISPTLLACLATLYLTLLSAEAYLEEISNVRLKRAWQVIRPVFRVLLDDGLAILGLAVISNAGGPVWRVGAALVAARSVSLLIPRILAFEDTIDIQLKTATADTTSSGHQPLAPLSRAVMTSGSWVTLLVCAQAISSTVAAVALFLAVVLWLPTLSRLASLIRVRVHQLNGSIEAQLKDHVTQLDPQVLVHCSGPTGAAYQINQWLPVLERCSKRILIVVRERHFFDSIAPTTIPIVLIRKVPLLDLVLGKSTRVVLYPANGQKNANLLRWAELTHIFINHGESDKVVNLSKTLRSYDKLYVAGQMAIDRADSGQLDIPHHRFERVGRPQADLTLETADGRPLSSRPIILYAPTWEGFNQSANYTSVVAQMIEAMKALLDQDIDVLFKAHPWTGLVDRSARPVLRTITAMVRAAKNGTVVGGDTDIHTLMNRSDMILTDVSSVLVDYLYTAKPIILTNVIGLSEEEFHNEFTSSRAAYILNPDFNNLNEVVNRIRTSDPLASERLRIKEYALGHWPQGALKRFDEQLDIDYLAAASRTNTKNE